MKPFIITNVKKDDLSKRKRNYLILMVIRVSLVPGVIFLPINAVLKSIIIFIAAVTQMIAVVSANTPNTSPENNANIIRKGEKEKLAIAQIEKSI